MCGKEIAAGQRGVLLKIKGISKDWETGLFLRLQNPGTGEYYRGSNPGKSGAESQVNRNFIRRFPAETCPEMRGKPRVSGHCAFWGMKRGIPGKLGFI